MAGDEATERAQSQEQPAEADLMDADASRLQGAGGEQPPDTGGPASACSSAADAGGPGPADEARELRRRVDELEALNRELTDRYLRLAADFDNFRRRTRQNEETLRAAATEALMVDLLPILDHLQLALAAAGEALESSFGRGVSLISQQLNEVLGRHGLEPVTAQGQPFDPQTMEAIATSAPTGDVPPGYVLEEYRRGYKLKGKLLRPSQVKVAQDS